MRIVAFRALRRYANDIIPYAQQLSEDPSSFVRREVIISLTDHPYNNKKPILSTHLKGLNADDRWYLAALGNAVSGHEEDFIIEANKIFNKGNDSANAWMDEMEALAWRLHPASYSAHFKLLAQSNKLSPAQRE